MSEPGFLDRPVPDVDGPILDEEDLRVAEALMARYPTRRSAMVPLLYLVQSKVGWVPPQGMREVAGLLDLRTAEVQSVASFYTMLKLHTAGRYVISICTNPPCALAGGRRLLERARELLGEDPEHVTPDGVFTLEEEECMGACDKAPVLSVNYVYYDATSEAELESMIAAMREGAPPEAPRGAGVPGDLRQVSRTLAGVGGLRPVGGAGSSRPVRKKKPSAKRSPRAGSSEGADG